MKRLLLAFLLFALPVRAQISQVLNATQLNLAGGNTDLTNYLTLQEASNSAGHKTFTFPASYGAASQFLQSDGAGNLTWATPSGTISGLTTNGVVYALSSTTIGSTAAGGNGQFLTNYPNGVPNMGNTFGTSLAANTQGAGLIFLDTTAATSGNQRLSPYIELSGYGYKSNATAASQQKFWKIFTTPVQGSTSATSELDFYNDDNNCQIRFLDGAISSSSGIDLASSGTYSMQGNILFSNSNTLSTNVIHSSLVGLGTVTSGTWNASSVTDNTNGITTTVTPGIIAQNTTASTSGVPVQQSPSLQLLAHVWSTTATAADSLSYFDLTNIPTSSTNPLVSKLTWMFGHASAQKAADLTTLATLDNSGNFTPTTLTPTNALGVAYGGTGLTTLTNHSIQIGAGSSTPTQLAVPASGTLLTGVASADPAFSATPTLGVAGTTTGSIAFANATGSNTTLLQGGVSAPQMTYILPTSAPTTNYVLQANGSTSPVQLSWVAQSGGGSISITSSTGDLTVSPSPLTGTGTIDLNLGNANTWLGLQTFTNPIGLTGDGSILNILGSDILADYNGGTNLLLGEGGTSITSEISNTGIGMLALQGVSGGNGNTAVGADAGYHNTSGSENIYLGDHAGFNSSSTASHQWYVGANSSGINGGISDAWFGMSDQAFTDTIPTNFTLHATGGKGPNIQGANLTLAGGIGTGNSTPGNVLIKTSTAGSSGSTQQTLSTIATFAPSLITFAQPLTDATGYQIAGAAPSGHYLRGNGTNYVDNTIQAGDLPSLSGVAVTSFSGGTTGILPNSPTQGAITLTGTLVPANGGTGTSTAFTSGSIVFAGSSGIYNQNNSNLFWDNTNNILELGNVSAGSVLSHSILNMEGNANNFIQATIQNISSGNTASSDFVATADNGTDSTHYIDLGINSSGYNQAAYNIGKADYGYLYATGGGLTIGTATSDSLIFHTGGTTASNRRMSIDGSGVVTIQGLGAGAVSTSSSGVLSSGTLSIGNGGTGITAWTKGDIPFASATNVLSNLSVGTNSQFLAGGTIPNWTDTIANNGIANTITPGVVLANTTASTSGATIQMAGAHIWGFHQWSTTATAHDSEREWREYVLPISGANPPASNWTLDFGNKNIGYTTMMKLSQGGIPTFPGFGQGGMIWLNSSGVTQIASFIGGTVFVSAGTNNGPANQGSLIYGTGTGTLAIGQATNVTGSVALLGSTSGTVTLSVLSTAGTGTDTLCNNFGAVATATRKSNGTMGQATLSSGTVTVSTTSVLTTSMIFLTVNDGGSNVGTPKVGTITNATSFVINSTNASDNSVINWWIINP